VSSDEGREERREERGRRGRRGKKRMTCGSIYNV
jgi:hypothetical protein